MQQTSVMPHGIELLYRNMIEKIGQTEKISDGNTLALAEKCISITREAMEKLRIYVTENSFQAERDEILFFKHIKPQFYCQFIYYLKIYRIEIDKPPGSKEAM